MISPSPTEPTSHKASAIATLAKDPPSFWLALSLIRLGLLFMQPISLLEIFFGSDVFLRSVQDILRGQLLNPSIKLIHEVFAPGADRRYRRYSYRP
jgi:hypothetical protein